MASPFSVFRKNQWTMMAILGVLLMIAFVVFPMLDLLVDSGRNQGGSPTAVELRKVGERLSEQQVADLRQRRDALLGFVGGVVDKAYGGGQFAYIYAQTVLGGSSEGAVVGSWLLQRKADDLGISISNKAINDFLKRLSGGRVTDAQLHSIAVERKMTDAQVFDWLRQELKAIYVRQMVLEEPAPADFNRWFRAYITRQPLPDGVTAVPPEQRFEYFEQTSASAELEILPIKIADLAKKIPAPSEDKLLAFFEEYKNKDARPRSADLGFKAPLRAKFEYLQADPKYVETLAAKQAVTDQEITKYYEENKKTLYVDRSASFEKGLDGTTEPPLVPDAKQPDEKTPDAKQPDAKGTPEKGDKQPEKSEKAPVEKADEKAAEKAKDDVKEAVKKKGDCTDPAEEGAEESSCQDAKGDAPKTEAPKTEALKTEALKTEAAKGAEAPKTEAAKGDAAKGAESPKDPEGVSIIRKKTDDDKKADDLRGPATPPPAPEVKFKPLDDALKADIKKQLQTKAARAATEKKLQEIRSNKMRKYGVEFVRWQHAVSEKKSTEKQPPAPDLKEVAEKEGLKYDRTPALSQFESSEFKPLNETIVGGGFPIAGGEGDAFFFRAYQDVKLFDPFFASDGGGENLFVFWKIEEIPTHVPAFKDVEEQVLAAWKLNEARKQVNTLTDDFLKVMAEKPADSLLGVKKNDTSKLPTDLALPADINDFVPPNPASKSLVELLGPNAADLVVQTRPFQWRMVFPNQMGQVIPRLNQFIEGIESADITEAFMQKVFSLKTGEFAKIDNPSQDTLYLVRVVRQNPAFKFDFLDRGEKVYLPLAAAQKANFVHGRFKELEFEYGLEWRRDLQAERE